MPLLTDATFVVTDIETTGLSPDKNRITEVACVYVRGGEIVEERRTLVNPEQFIPNEIQKMTGITNAMVFAAPKGGDVFPQIREWIAEDAIFVAHNVSFDYNFLQSSFRRHGIDEMRHAKLCTARLARRLLPAQKRWGLGHLTAHLGIKVQGRHHALGDARATALALIQMIELLQEEHDCETVEDLLSIQYQTMSNFRELPKHIKALEPVLSALPPRPGVYRMIAARGEVLYIGKAKSLRDRVGSYFRHGAIHTSKIREMVGRVRKIEVEETGSELGALLLESRLIKEYQPKYNTMQKRYRRYAFLRLTTGNAYPRVDFSLEIEPDGAEYFGPFRNRDAVEAMIETINQSFGLRECAGDIIPNENIVPCFYYQIKRCGAPCAALQSPGDYAREVDRVRGFLSGADTGIISLLERKMTLHAESLEFEEAAALRNRVNELRKIFRSEERIAESINRNNVIIILPAAEEGKREIFLVRFGRLAAQVVIGTRPPAAKLAKLAKRHYFDGATAPSHCRREEIDEIKIIASYLHLYRDAGRFIYVEDGESTERVVERVVMELRGERREPVADNAVE
ncbi:MAG: DEDD exonuclease domain-containing protein [Candidatus Kapaibacterium sp.]